MALNDRSEHELQVIYQIAQASIQHSNVSALLMSVLDILEEELQLVRAALVLRNPETDMFEIKASKGLSDKEERLGRYRLGEGITGIVAETGEPAIVPDISKDRRFLDRTGARSDNHLAFLCVPIRHLNRVIGTLSVDRPMTDERELNSNLELLQMVTNIVAEAVSRMREQIEEEQNLIKENERLRRRLDDNYKPANIIGNCGSMRLIYEQIAQVADSSATVLIRGETGTGKELVAHAIHSCSPRAKNAFIAVNCAALPDSLIESELFGHEKGSFTGATSQRKGRFELANGGTIFLDEIGDIPTNTQMRLLRVLQERYIERVGGTSSIPVDVRIIAATNRDLEKAIAEGKFRDDLYYRLNVFPINMPPLRERRSDIMLLADHFVEKYNRVYNKKIKRISTAAINMMMKYHWPGNVREIENCIERAVLTSNDSIIHGYSLPPSLQTSENTNTDIFKDPNPSLKDMVDNYEREVIIDALKKFRGNASACARHLNTTQRIMNYRIKQLGVNAKDYR
jgi:Nif-specific regulatory protein